MDILVHKNNWRTIIKDEVLITVGCPIFPSILIANVISVHRKLNK